MIEMKSAEHKDCFTIAMFFPPPLLHGATESLKKRKKAWSNRLYTPPGGTLGLYFGWGCAAGLEPFAYTRASSVEFCYPILD